jgi:hypothetical protein
MLTLVSSIFNNAKWENEYFSIVYDYRASIGGFPTLINLGSNVVSVIRVILKKIRRDRA